MVLHELGTIRRLWAQVWRMCGVHDDPKGFEFLNSARWDSTDHPSSLLRSNSNIAVHAQSTVIFWWKSDHDHLPLRYEFVLLTSNSKFDLERTTTTIRPRRELCSVHSVIWWKPITRLPIFTIPQKLVWSKLGVVTTTRYNITSSTNDTHQIQNPIVYPVLPSINSTRI